MNLVTNYSYNGTDSFNTVYANQPNNSIYLFCPAEGSKIFTDLGYTATGQGTAGLTIMSVKWSSWRGFVLSIPYIWDDAGGCYKFGRISGENSIIWRDVLDGENLSDINASISSINSTINTLADRSICAQGNGSWVDGKNISCPAGDDGITVTSFTIGSQWRNRYGFIEISVQVKSVSQDTCVSIWLEIDSVQSYHTSTILAGKSGRISLSTMMWMSDKTYKIKFASHRSTTVEAYLYRYYTFRPDLLATTPA